ncbi:MAG: hypothetical protein F6J93_11225 [Oscillatoria sp. SIO1A7]|nr:hypothetical protein [Oscillatoria sp. SIO1A7]
MGKRRKRRSPLPSLLLTRLSELHFVPNINQRRSHTSMRSPLFFAGYLFWTRGDRTCDLQPTAV